MSLRLLAIGIGVFFVAMSLQKVGWLFDSGVLLQRLEGWLPTAAPSARWYLDTIAIPGVAVFARVVPVAELSAGLALILGVWPRAASALALVMVMNFHFATGAFFAWEILRDGTGPPLLAGLLALAVAGKDLPFAMFETRRARLPQRLSAAEPDAYTELS